MSRLTNFLAMKRNAWFRRSWDKLTQKEIKYGIDWIAAHDHLDANEFQAACNKMGLDQSEFRASMKNFERLQEMISNSNVEVKK
jgi:hypothetical protein